MSETEAPADVEVLAGANHPAVAVGPLVGQARGLFNPDSRVRFWLSATSGWVELHFSDPTEALQMGKKLTAFLAQGLRLYAKHVDLFGSPDYDETVEQTGLGTLIDLGLTVGRRDGQVLVTLHEPVRCHRLLPDAALYLADKLTTERKVIP